MPYANNHGVHIHYQVDGQGPPLVMQHGMTQTLMSWYDSGYVDGLKQDYPADSHRRPGPRPKRQTPRPRSL